MRGMLSIQFFETYVELVNLIFWGTTERVIREVVPALNI